MHKTSMRSHANRSLDLTAVHKGCELIGGAVGMSTHGVLELIAPMLSEALMARSKRLEAVATRFAAMKETPF